MVVVVTAQPTEVVSERFFVPDCILQKILQCSCASVFRVLGGYDEILEGTIFAELTCSLQGDCTPGV